MFLFNISWSAAWKKVNLLRGAISQNSVLVYIAQDSCFLNKSYETLGTSHSLHIRGCLLKMSQDSHSDDPPVRRMKWTHCIFIKDMKGWRRVSLSHRRHRICSLEKEKRDTDFFPLTFFWLFIQELGCFQCTGSATFGIWTCLQSGSLFCLPRNRSSSICHLFLSSTFSIVLSASKSFLKSSSECRTLRHGCSLFEEIYSKFCCEEWVLTWFIF